MSEEQRRLGARLRAIRRQQSLTLHDVEERSDGQWKAVVVGSYERGDRAISITKLARLAAFYSVPMHDLLPSDEHAPSHSDDDPIDRICLSLEELSRRTNDDVLTAVSRFVRRLQVERGDYNGRVMTVRREDIHAIALAFGLEPADLIDELDRTRTLVR